MLPEIPYYLFLVFLATTMLCIHFFSEAARNYRFVPFILIGWGALQTLLSLKGFYLDTNSVPPRLMLLIGPPLVLTLVLFLTKKGRRFIDGLNLKWLTWLHVVRIPVEICLYLLFLQKMVPQLMTFEGRNFDLLSGISAPVIALVALKYPQKKKLLLVWNFICLGLLLNVVINGVLAAPSVFQQQAFDQPNIAVLYFPYSWLPSIIVPLVLFSHLAAIRQLVKK